MMSAQEGFADLTALLEDLHGLAVEGQHPDLTESHANVLCANLTLGSARTRRVVSAISRLPWVAVR